LQKLLYITTNLDNTGGVARILSVKLNYLVQKYDYNIFVINTNKKSNTFFYSFSEQIKFYFLETKLTSLKNIFKYKKELNTLINEVRPDIIINCDNGLKGSLASYFIKYKAILIYESHGSKNINVATFKERFKIKLSNFILDRSINKYNKFIVLNNFEKDFWKSSKILTIPNPIWFELPKNTKELVDNIVVAVGRHSYEKRYDRLIKIWKEVIKEHPNWILKIYGEKNEDIQIEKDINKLNIADNVIICTPVKNIQNVYLNASLLLNTSSSEAFGLVIIEAMAYGLPVIAFNNISGPKSIISTNENGFLIDENDINKYIEKTKLLISNQSLRQQMGVNAKNSLKRFELQSIMKLWHNLFQSIQ